MTKEEFNIKWIKYLKDGFENQGLMIEDEEVSEYLDAQFKSLTKLYPTLKYCKILLRFGLSRVYIENVPIKVTNMLEDRIDKIIENNNQY